MPVEEGVQAGVFLGVTGTAAVAAAWRASGRMAGRDALDRAVATAVLALGGLCAVLLVLGIAGLLTRTAVGIAIVVAAAAVLLRVRPVEVAAGGARDARAERLVLLGVGALFAGLALSLGLQGETTSNDTLHYHAVNAGTWLDAGSLRTLPLATPGYLTNAYPSDHTLTALWLMLATGSDQLAYVVNVLWGILAVLGAALLGRELGARWTTAGLLGLGVVVTPIVFDSHADSLYSDLAAAGGIAAGAGFALRAVRDEEGRTRWAVLAGIALGLAAGSKYTAFAPAAGVMVVPVVLLGRRGLRPALAMLAAAAPLVLFWLVRNAAEFGNPLYPQAIGPFDGYTSPLGVFETPIATHILDGNWDVVGRWLRLARELVGLAFLLPLAGVVAGALAWHRGRRDAATIAGVVLISVAGYLWTPFTGGGPDGTEFLIGSQLRYALPALLLSAPLVAALAPRALALGAAAVMLAFGLYELRDAGARPELDLGGLDVAIGLAAAAGVLVLARLRRVPPIAVCAVLIAIATAATLKIQDPAPPTTTERLLATCQDPTIGIVAVTDVRSLMGRDFDLDIVSIDEPAAAGRRPILDAAALDRRIAAMAPDLVVGAPGPTQARGWDGPRGWRKLASEGPASFYAPPDGCASS